MKRIYTTLIASFTILFTQAQIVNIPDANFKNALISSGVDTDGDGEIQVYEAATVHTLYLTGLNITDLTGISSFINIERLFCAYNELNVIDLSNNTLLKQLIIYNSSITSLDLSNNLLLEDLQCGYNLLSSLDLSNNVALKILNASYNQLNNINLNNLTVLEELYVPNNQISNIELSTNLGLMVIDCSENQITNIDLSNNTNLSFLDINNNLLTSLDLSFSPMLDTLYCNNNQLTDIDLTSNSNMINFIGSYNQFFSLDLSSFSNIEYNYINNNPNLVYLNYKTGNNNYLDIHHYGNFEDLPNLQVICVDDANSEFTYYWGFDFEQEIIFTEYCSFTPGGEFYTISGNIILDADNNGCDSEDVLYPNLMLQITNGEEESAFLSNSDGSYTTPILEGNYTITPQLENPTYFTVMPASISVDFPNDTSPFVQDFCITPNGTFNDLEIKIIPIEDARPGFDTDYKLIYKNKGTTILSGVIEFSFNDDLMNLLSTTPVADFQTIGNLLWNFNDLLPFETREINLTMTLNTPTNQTFPLNGDDILEFVASINTTETDETENDNTFTLNQVVVNSYDPNDKTCLEGLIITPEQIGDYIHYRIRFENTGTASAVNVVVKDVIDVTKYDISTLVSLHASHPYETRIRNNNEVEFIFENIQLPFDDANNDGYIFFKIKTLSSLVLGDSFSNQAEIFFDFNFPIITNNETTVVEENLSIDKFELSNSLKLYPNPTGAYFEIQNINRITIETIELHDISGKKLKQFTLSERYSIDELVSGIYFVKIITESSEVIKKIVKI